MGTPEHGLPDDVAVAPVLADPAFVEAVEDAVAGSHEVVTDRPDRVLGLDPHDFSGLYIRHRGQFAALAQRYLHDPRDVDEVLQEAFLRLFLALPELDTELAALAYCRRTVTNLCIDRYRADRRRPRLVDLDQVDVDPEDDAAYDDPVLRAEDAAVVREALALLSPLHREALIAREVEEKPLPQIAAELGVPEESVKHLLFRARRSLRRLLVGTSVEPGAALSGREITRLAHERAARGMMRGAGVLIVMFVAVCSVALGIRPNTEGRGVESGSVGAVSRPESAGPVPAAPARPRFAPHRKPGLVQRVPRSTAANPSGRSPAGEPAATGGKTHASAPKSHPRVHRSGQGSPSGPTSTPTTPAPPQSSVAPYTLTGALRSTTVPTIAAAPASVLTRVTASGSLVTGQQSVSYFLATTTVGPLHLAQTLTRWSDGTSSMAVAPVQPDSAAVPAVPAAVQSVSVAPDADGRVGADVSVVAPLASLGLPSAPMTMHLVYSADLSSVLLEHVAVSDATVAPVSAVAPGPSADPTVSNGGGQGSDAVEPLPATAPAVTREEVNGSSLTS